MTRCITRVATLLLSLTLLAGCVTAPELNQGPGAPAGFRQIAWGASPDSQLQRPPVSVTSEISVYRLASGKRQRHLLGVLVAEEAYSFYEDHFFSGSASLDGKENFERMKAALIKNYGEPEKEVRGYDRHSTTSEPQRSGFKDMWVWQWPGSTAQVRLSYHAIHQRVTVTYINDAIRKASAGPAAQASEEKAAATP